MGFLGGDHFHFNTADCSNPYMAYKLCERTQGHRNIQAYFKSVDATVSFSYWLSFDH